MNYLDRRGSGSGSLCLEHPRWYLWQLEWLGDLQEIVKYQSSGHSSSLKIAVAESDGNVAFVKEHRL